MTSAYPDTAIRVLRLKRIAILEEWLEEERAALDPAEEPGPHPKAVALVKARTMPSYEFPPMRVERDKHYPESPPATPQPPKEELPPSASLGAGAPDVVGDLLDGLDDDSTDGDWGDE